MTTVRALASKTPRTGRRCCLPRLGNLVGVVAAIALTATISGQVADRRSRDGLHYRLEGIGEAVVLIHAFQMDLREWDEVVADLASSRTVLRYDVRGHGTSTPRTPLPSPTADLLALFDELEIGRATLVGLSMGSTIAVEFALSHPERVARLVLVSPDVPGLALETVPDTAWMRPIFDAVRQGHSEKASELWWQSALFDRVRQGTRATGARRIVLENHQIWTQQPSPPAARPKTSGTRLGELTMPVLCVAGQIDPLPAPEIARRVSGGVARGRLVIIPRAGHMLSLEAPHEISRLILAAR